ncbi:phosphatase PAP2 family protein [Vibrio parahaemolyticus]|uniref:phosphatase PAP2 family protein n=1 Tax=Vibrio TaxID=662 RepID=UPI00146A6915|nr:phosphatase PAP2 family protein [Vibrio parahaemolyticus]MDF5020774.1 phosphatase PAP2 family protein [Vibrio parahaemolyticus]MDF5040109.1 phosphatase PAP2 family protein [Vibrio parahaemolyticus]MDF5046213.1 phosphatase PAP2 family protein [Vibrio parahaemolyticus]MDF5090315.1 phosphatase PAP2 family protein [Vibrio parahaemolyticus]MDF5135028.1 phosphatase PAP2 family protein [Vibrio parahaemolyticus]
MEQENNYELNLSWQQKTSSWIKSVKDELSTDIIFYLYSFGSTAIIYFCSWYLDSPINYSFSTYYHLFTVTTCAAILGAGMYYYFYLLVQREKRPLNHFKKKVHQLFFPLYRTISIFLSLLAINFIVTNHTFLKSLIPLINPFKWDHTFAELDRLLHFGVAPWELTHSLFSSPWASLSINFAYNLWFFLMWGSAFFFCIYYKLPLLRLQFLLTFALLWMINSIWFATLFSSAGPCYMELLTGDAQYAPLMKLLTAQSLYLENIGASPLWSLSTQDYLWHEYLENANSFGSGISAMPSMHVSMSVLMALSICRLNKKLGYFAYAFAILIQIGSVHLGWHYAIDGYVGTLLTVLLWKIVGWFIKRNTMAV